MKFTLVILTALLCLNANAADMSKESDEAIEAAANQLIAEGGRIVSASDSVAVSESATATKTVANADTATDADAESQIPVVTEVKKAEKSESNLAFRMIASLGIVLVVAGCAAYAGKKYRRHKDKGGSKARIEIMHQLHLGPKKSVGLIRVAGEAILIGITDQNINMLKSVALIDDELENVVGKNFNNFLEEDFSIEDVRNALGPRV
jgi:flagellar biogenesis protein FliO